ncbi:hypothetical protein [Tenacibaculum sp.]|uniref:hypothetical protein n=1 Tax=Tenacibaculum sp. TaxID=1906242 RepID=UPI003D127C3C
MENHNRIERPEGKFARNFKVALDVQSKPKDISPELWLKLIDNGFILYDSELGNRPKLYETGTSSGEDKLVPVMIDVKGEEVNIEDFNKQFADEEYWRKELYNCKQSPLYYFTNYVSVEPKPSQGAITKFLEENGFGAKDDSADATVVSEKIKEAREKFSATITLEKLKDLKPVRDRIDAEYELITKEIVEEASKKFELSESNEKGLSAKIITAIMKTKAKEAPDKLKYYVIETSGRWDKNLLRATDFDVLLRLWKLINY